MTDPGGFATVRFSTADLPERDRVAMWREHYGHRVFRIDIEPVRDAAFQAAVVSRSLPELRLVLGMMSAGRITRTHEFVADGTNDLALIVNLKGAVTTTARGREVVLGEGDAVLKSSSEISVFDRLSPGSSFSIRIPHAVLSPLVIDVGDAVMRLIPRDTEALRLLTSYVRPLLRHGALASPEIRRLAVAHVHDLVALTLGATRDAAGVAESRGMRAARLRAAKAYVVENSSRRNLSVGSVAAHLGVTPRYLQRLFESDGGTFSALLLAQRLASAHRMLTQSRFAQYAVSAIAYDAGFGDLSYFNRSFRQRYGATPRDIRETAAR
jgi:AraC-like DNA-binding protein